jgi:hypothetical protein
MGYRVAKTNGRWHFVDPKGDPFYLRGVYAVGWDDSKAWTYQQYYGGGDDWKMRWADDTLLRLRAWGFNCIAQYSRWEVWSMPPHDTRPTAMPHLHAIRPAAYVMEQYGGSVPDLIANADSSYTNWRNASLPDPFNERFELEVERYFVEKRDDFFRFGDPKSPWLLGIVCDDADNLFGFGPGAQSPAPRVHPTITEIVAANKDSAAYKVMHAMSAQKARAFQYAFCKRYFSVVAAAVRKHVPGVLVFGPAAFNQWGGVSRPAVLNAAGEEFDVVQLCIGSRQAYDISVARVGDKPIVTWDTVVANPDSGIGGQNPVEVPQWPPTASSQAERGVVYSKRNALMRSLPNIAGSIWWSLGDHRGERMNFGLVNSNTNVPYGPFVDAVARSNAEPIPDGVRPLDDRWEMTYSLRPPRALSFDDEE